MPIVCPTITAHTAKEYEKQLHKVMPFAHRIQIDLTDGIFAGPLTVEPADAWWPAGSKADFHLMYDHPMSAIKTIAAHKPHLIIVHAEAKGDFDEVADYCRTRGIKVGVALLQKTEPQKILAALGRIDHVLIFSGNLGHQGGGHIDFNLLGKVKALKAKKADLEIGWDGGVNSQSVSQLVFGGVDVLNVGSYIQNADDPVKTFHSLQRIADETGTT